MAGILVGGRIKYIPRPGYIATAPADFAELSRGVAPSVPRVSDAKPRRRRRERAPRAKFDPSLLAKVREFRDRWMEYVDANGLPCAGMIEGKYEVSRVLPPRLTPAGQNAPKALPEAA